MSTAAPTPRVINLAEGFARIHEAWSPHVGGDINDMQIKLVKLSGEFHWHHHDLEDELFLVTQGEMLMRLRTGDVHVRTGEYIIVPRTVEHCPVALTPEVQCILLEPRTTLNTGNVINERTRQDLGRID
jgi:mannose-6-phosphate isomerase-like protein (cupin superfamily)